MAKEPKKKMTQEEIAEWNELYQYVRKQIFQYDDNQMLSSYTVLRLKGLVEGKFMSNNNTKQMANYSYKVVLATFKFCKEKIRNGMNMTRFKDENHRINFVMKIVENNINTVYTKMKKAEEAKRIAHENMEDYDTSYVDNYKNRYKPTVLTEAQKETAENLKDLF